MENNTPQRTFKVKDSMRLEDGAHSGVITRVEFRDEPYQYVDFVIKVNDKEFEMKYGCPQNLSVNSKLGLLIEKFGKSLKVNDEFTEQELIKLFVGRKVKFVTITETSKKENISREYSRIADGSLKPLD